METRGMSASGGLPMKIHGQDGRATKGVWQANSLPIAMHFAFLLLSSITLQLWYATSQKQGWIDLRHKFLFTAPFRGFTKNRAGK